MPVPGFAGLAALGIDAGMTWLSENKVAEAYPTLEDVTGEMEEIQNVEVENEGACTTGDGRQCWTALRKFGVGHFA